jgi:phosphate transport system protein
MFSKFKELFSSENLLDSAFKTTLTMIEFDQKMYNAARHSLRESNTAELPFDVRQMDRKINKYEREVRRQVITHLTIAGIHDLAPGLALVSIVIDVERIGDYTKNIVDLAKIHENRLMGGLFENDVQNIETTINDTFDKVINVIKSHDKQIARAIMQAEPGISQKAESIIKDIITGKKHSLSTPDAVSLSMYARYLKRINSHLTNVASSIVNPFPRIGFREKSESEKKKS